MATQIIIIQCDDDMAATDLKSAMTQAETHPDVAGMFLKNSCRKYKLITSFAVVPVIPPKKTDGT